jgi:hypothetical protein
MKLPEIPNLRPFKVSYVSQTDKTCSRIRIEDLYYDANRAKPEQLKVKFIPFDSDTYNNTLDVALEWFIKNGFNPTARANTPDYYLVMCDNWGEDFKILKKEMK